VAGFINMYPNLPGHLVEFKDGGMVLRNDPIPQETDSVLLLGTAIDGPVGEPVAIDMTTLESLYGKDVDAKGKSNGATLVKAAKALYATGVRDIRCMRITGSSAEAVLTKSNTSVLNSQAIEEHIGFGVGNSETQIELNFPDVVESSIKVYVNGVVLKSVNYSVSKESLNKTKITIKPSTCEANANIQVIYNYTQEETVLSAVESASALGEAYLTKKNTQTAKLKYAPIDDSLRVYADGVEILKDAYVLNSDNRTVTLKSEFYPLGSQLSAYYVYSVSSEVTPTIVLQSKYGGELYNQCSVSVSKLMEDDVELGRVITLTKPSSKRAQASETPLVYHSTDYPTFGELVQAINEDVNNNVFLASTEFEDAETAELTPNVTESNVIGEYFTGGRDGITTNKVELYEALSGIRDTDGYILTQGAYQLLENYIVDWVVPLGVYANDVLPGKYQNFAYELALYCAIASHQSKTTLGVISTRPCENTSLKGVADYVARTAAFENLYYMRDTSGNFILGADGRPIDLGMYISVVAGPEVQFSSYTLGKHYVDPSIAYVGLNATIPVQQAPTNKVVQGATGVKFRLSNKQHNELLGNRYVTMKVKNDNGLTSSGQVCATDGVTAASSSSDYTRISTAKIVRETVDHIREVSEPYIGNPNTVEQRNALSSALSKRLGQLQTNGTLNSYEFAVISTATDQLLGQARIELTLQAPQELRRITTVVSLTV
jgi:hypothetical protein